MSLAAILKMVEISSLTWAKLKPLIGSSIAVKSPDGHEMTADELEPHILKAEQARDAASQHAATRIDQRHAHDDGA